MCRIILTVCALFFCLFAEAHSGKARFHVIIDTDGAADDLRAICMLLSNREVETLAITTSEGALTPVEAAEKVTALLHGFHHEGIPVGVGRALGIAPPAWRRQSQQIVWSDVKGTAPNNLTATDVIVQAMENENEKIIFFCFGGLTNLNDMLSAKPALKERIERVIWYNTSASPLQGANYDADRASADRVLASGVQVDMVSGEGRHEIVIDGLYMDFIAGVDNAYAKKIAETHGKGVLKSAVETRHLKMWDDLAVVYLFAPELFTSVSIHPTVSMYSLANAGAAGLAKGLAAVILAGKPDSESRVFFGFPDDPTLYAADVAPVVKKIIARHGRSEWRAGVLTNELHGHLGIYAIIGVKMGIRAREFFNIGVDDVFITTYAGLQPPVSCLNDGLQVSTGGTLGHGLIAVAPDENIRPEATFTFKNKTLRLKLKPVYAQQIRKDVEDAIRQHGNLTEPYWEKIRALAIKYWEEFNRHEMFDVKY
jgi:pyrimidine-specific ribonucleoside hydrolase